MVERLGIKKASRPGVYILGISWKYSGNVLEMYQSQAAVQQLAIRQTATTSSNLCEMYWKYSGNQFGI